MQTYDILNAIKKETFISVMRANDKESYIDMANALYDGGINVMEVTLTTPGSLEIMQTLTDSDKDFIVGAGTVLDAETARVSILNGARFIVSPYFDEHTAKLCHVYGIPYVPGCATLKEMATALQAGCPVLKLFPAAQFSPKSIKDFKGPMPNLELIPTGGVGIHNCQEWLDAGSFAVGIGSDITKAYKNGGVKQVTDYAKSLKGVK